MSTDGFNILILSIFVNNQLDVRFSYIYLFQFSICFEQPIAHHQESQLYQYDLWYMSLYVGDRVVCRFNPAHHTATYIQ